MKSRAVSEARGVKNVNRVIDLLEAFKEYPDGLTLSSLSSYLNLPKSTVSRLLYALMDRQLIRESKPPGKYLLGHEILRLSLAYHKGFDLYREAHPRLEELNRKIDETVILGILNQTQHQIIYIDKLDTKQSIMLGSQIGETAPIHCTALGKALLSGFSDDELFHILADYEFKKFTDHTITELEKFLEELVHIRRVGYAIDHQEYKSQIVCVAAPIFNFAGEPLAAISVSAPINRLEAQRQEEVVHKVLETANEISQLLAYVPVKENED